MCTVILAERNNQQVQWFREQLAHHVEIGALEHVNTREKLTRALRRTQPSLLVINCDFAANMLPEMLEAIMHNTPLPIVVYSMGAPIFDETLFLQSGAALVLSDITQQSDLAGTLLSMADLKVVRRRKRPTPNTAFQLVAISCSAGGPDALQRLLSALPQDFPLPILIAQHIATGFSEGLAQWLDMQTPLAVHLACDRMQLQPGHVYIAPDHHHLGVYANLRCQVSDAPPVGGFRPSGSFLFHSIATNLAAPIIALVLTGMGRDGADALAELQQHGSHIIAQNRETSVVFGMPQAAIATGLVDAVLPLESIPYALLSLTQHTPTKAISS